jgi:hypothetical protein
VAAVARFFFDEAEFTHISLCSLRFPPQSSRKVSWEETAVPLGGALVGFLSV